MIAIDFEKMQGLAPAIVQDEATSVVFGMPRAAAEAGAVNAVLPLDGIPSILTTYVDDIVRAAKRGRRAV